LLRGPIRSSKGNVLPEVPHETHINVRRDRHAPGVERCSRCAEQLDGQACFADLIVGIDIADTGCEHAWHTGDHTAEWLDQRQQHTGAATSARRTSTSSQAANPPQGHLDGLPQSSEPRGASTPGAASTAPTASASRRAQGNTAPSFTLSSASQGSSPTSAEPRSVGTTGNTPSSASTPPRAGGSGSYTLQGMDLSRQVGQQVEVTGVPVLADTGRNARSRATVTSGANDSTASAERIRVTSVRMVSEHCSGQ